MMARFQGHSANRAREMSVTVATTVVAMTAVDHDSPGASKHLEIASIPNCQAS